MKKILYFIFIFFLALINKNALGQNRGGINNISGDNIGLEIGPSLTQNIRGSLIPAESYNFIMGYSLGMFYEHYLNSNISYKINILYSRKIVSENFDYDNIITNEYEIKLWQNYYNYASLPLLAKINIMKNRFFFDAGPCIDTYLGAKAEVWNSLTDSYGVNNYNKNVLRRFVLYLTAGFGANIPVGKKYDMSFEIRDNYGLTRIDVGTGSSNNKKSRISLNSELFLYSFTYHIPDKKKK